MVQHRVPIAELIARREARQSQRRGVGDGLGRVGQRHAAAERGHERVNGRCRVVFKQRVYQGCFPLPGRDSVEIEHGRELGAGRLDERGQIDRMLPGVALLLARGGSDLRDDVGQDLGRLLPANEGRVARRLLQSYPARG